ncbi:MAG: FAD-dependent 5-carboxymethylaminomethyl-2-thiouridine(34) oxidoreductase MnmC [Granulosicoccus sp.]
MSSANPPSFRQAINLPWNSFTPVKPGIKAEAEDTRAHNRSCEIPVIVGAGLAGCWLARTLAERGVRVCLIEQSNSVAAGASGNPAGIAKPFVTRTPSMAMLFYALAHDYLLQQLSLLKLAEQTFIPCGVAQLVQRAYPPSTLYQCMNAMQTDQRIGHNSRSEAIFFASSGWLKPDELCNLLARHPLIDLKLDHKLIDCRRNYKVNEPPGWTLNFEQHEQRDCQHLVLANGHSLSMLPETRELPIVPARGQLSRFELSLPGSAPSCIVNGKHYVIPDGNTVLVGASFQRNIDHSHILENDHEQNRLGISRLLPDLQINPIALAGYAGVRATTPDRLPLIGPIPDWLQCSEIYARLRHGDRATQYAPLPLEKGLYVLGGFGSRGIVTAPLAAKLLADYLMGHNTLQEWSPLVNPARFRIREIKRGVSTVQTP